MVDGKQFDMNFDDTEADKAHLTPEHHKISLINQTYRAGYRKIEDYLDSLPPERAKSWRKRLKLPEPAPEEES